MAKTIREVSILIKKIEEDLVELSGGLRSGEEEHRKDLSRWADGSIVYDILDGWRLEAIANRIDWIRKNKRLIDASALTNPTCR